MRYFFDNDISPSLAHMLKALDIDATALRDVFDPKTVDVVFLSELKNDGYDVLISNNTEQRKIPQEKRALKESGIISLYFNPFWSKMKFWDQATWLVQKWPQIEGFCRGTAKGTCADLQRNGKASLFNL